MTPKPVIPRAAACADVDYAVEHYAETAGVNEAQGFIDALERAYAFVAGMPAAGSPRWSHELALPGLRTLRLKRFPWLMFYLERESHIDVLRVLHAKQDVPAWLSGAEGE